MEAVGRLAGGIAHDFNNPLTAIGGYAQLALDDPALSPTVKGDLEQITRGAERATDLTRQLLAFSRQGALAALEDLKAERRDGLKLSKQSLGAYLRSWLDESARPSISANTYRGYEDVLAHLTPVADITLHDLSAEDLERVFNRMTVKRGRVQQPASAKTVRNAQIMVRRALRSAEQRGHVRRNVALQVPLRHAARHPREALTPDMARRILLAVDGDRYDAAYALALVGLREGEILGLAWQDVDLAVGTAVVRYELIGSGPSATRHQVKTQASEATVPLPPFVVARLRAHLERQRKERPERPLDDGLVFVTPRGYAVNGSWLTKHFQALLERAGLPRMRLHDLRHGAASLLVGAAPLRHTLAGSGFRLFGLTIVPRSATPRLRSQRAFEGAYPKENRHYASIV